MISMSNVNRQSKIVSKFFLFLADCTETKPLNVQLNSLDLIKFIRDRRYKLILTFYNFKVRVIGYLTRIFASMRSA